MLILRKLLKIGNAKNAKIGQNAELSYAAVTRAAPHELSSQVARSTDCLLMNVHHLHGNLPLTFGGTRLTGVFYARQKINECGTRRGGLAATYASMVTR